MDQDFLEWAQFLSPLTLLSTVAFSIALFCWCMVDKTRHLGKDLLTAGSWLFLIVSVIMVLPLNGGPIRESKFFLVIGIFAFFLVLINSKWLYPMRRPVVQPAQNNQPGVRPRQHNRTTRTPGP